MRLGPGLNSTSPLNKIERLYNHACNLIVIIAARKDSVWKCLVYLYELDFNLRKTEMGRHSLKRHGFDKVALKSKSIYSNSYGC